MVRQTADSLFVRFAAYTVLCGIIFTQVFPVTALAAARTSPFAPGETLDPGLAATEPCGPTDTNCFPTSGTVAKVGTQANGTLATDFENSDTVDGVVLKTNDLIVVQNQTTVAENGIYRVNATGAPTLVTSTVGAGAFITSGTDANKSKFIIAANIFGKVGDSASGGITSLNSLTGSTQTFATGTAGTDFGISSSGSVHTFNIPTSSATNRGLLSSTDWTTFNNKQSTTLANGSVWVGNASNLATAVSLSGDATITNAGVLTIGNTAVTLAKLATDAVNSSKIVDGSIALADMASDAVNSATIVDSSITNADVSATAAIVYTKLSLGNSIVLTDLTTDSVNAAKIVDGSIVAADLATDAVISSKILDGSITDADISASAAIALSKLASGTSGQIIVANASGVPVYVAMSGDTTVDNAGAVTIANLAVTTAKINADAVTTAKILDGTILNADIANATIDLTTKVTGILPIANGGTGSSTQNFVDLTTGQTVAGAKTFSGAGSFTAAGTGLAVTNNATVGGTFGVTGISTLTGAQTLVGNTDVQGTLADSTGNVTIGDNVDLTGTLAVTGDETVSGTLGVTGIATFTVAPVVTAFSTGGIVHNSAAGLLSSSLIVNADVAAAAAIAYSKLNLTGSIVNADITNSTIDLTTKVTGILPIANGGTGSATQNFVDLTTAQTIAGAKTFSSATTLSSTLDVAGTQTNTGNISQTGATTFSTGTGAVTLNGATSVSGANTFAVGTGATTLGGTLGVTGTGTFTLAPVVTAFSTGGIVHNSAAGLLSSSLIVNADIAAAASIAYSKLNLTSSIVNADITNSTIDLTTKVTGILSIANGGTGSATQNFVDLTTAQTVAGIKTFTDNALFGSGGTVHTLNADGSFALSNGAFTLDPTGKTLSMGDSGRTYSYNGDLMSLSMNGPNGVNGIFFDRTDGSENMYLQSSDLTAMYVNPRYNIDQNPYIGFGTNAPEQKLDVAGGIQWRGQGTAPAVSSAGNGSIYFDTATNKFKVSQNNGAYSDLISGGSIGGAVSGGLPTGLLFVDSSGNLSSDSGITYDAATDKLTLVGGLDPLYVQAKDTINVGNEQAYFEAFKGDNAAVSALNTGRMRYNSTTQTWQLSENGGAYTDILGSGPGASIYSTNGTLTGNRTITSAGFDLSIGGTGGFSTGTGDVTLNGHTTISAGKNLTVGGDTTLGDDATADSTTINGVTTINSDTSTTLTLNRSSAGQWLSLVDGTDSIGLFNTTASPEGSVGADTGSLAIDSSAGKLYIKTTDASNAGWKGLAILNGSANTFSGFDSNGDLASVNGWAFDSTTGGANVSHNVDADFNTGGNFNLHNFGMNVATPNGDAQNVNWNLFNKYANFNPTNITDGINWLALDNNALNLSNQSGTVQNAYLQNGNITTGDGNVGNMSADNQTINMNGTGAIQNASLRGGSISSGNGDVNFMAIDNSNINMTGTGAVQNAYLQNGNISTGNGNVNSVNGNNSVINVNGTGVVNGLNGFGMYLGGSANAIITNANIYNQGVQFNNGVSMDYFNAYNGYLNLDGTTNAAAITQNANAYNYGVSLTDATINNLTLFNAYVNQSGASSIQNFKGIQMNASGNITNAQGLNIDLSSVVSPNRIVSGSFGGESFSVYSSLDSTKLTAPFDQSNLIGGQLTISTPIVGTEYFQNNMDMNIIAHDDMDASGPLGVGAVGVGNVGQFEGIPGATVDSVNMSLSAMAISGASTGGNITNWNAYNTVGLINFGGVIDSALNVYAYRVSPAFGSVGTNIFGVAVDATTADNYFNKSITIGGTQTTNAGIGIDIQSKKAIKLGSLTTAERDALTAIAGMQIYNETTNETNYYNGTAWVASAGGGLLGGAVAGASDSSTAGLLYVDSNGNLAQDTGLLYDPVTDKLTVIGGVDPLYLQAKDVVSNSAAYFEAYGGQSAAVSEPNTGRLIYNAVTQKWQISKNGGAYVDLISADSDIASSLQDVSNGLVDVDGLAPLSAADVAPSDSFAVKFFKGLAKKMIAWFADTTNGIGAFFAGEIHAKDKVCVGQTCVDETQLQALLANAQSGSSGGGSGNADTEAPIVTLGGLAEQTIAINDTWNDLGATATDNVLAVGDVTVSVNGAAAVVAGQAHIDTSADATFTLVYTATDAAGNHGSATRTVTVGAGSAIPPADTENPVVTIVPGTDTVSVGDTWTDIGATVTDNVTQGLMAIASGTVNTQTAGVYTIVYTATDEAGNVGSATRTVTVEAVNP